MTVEVQDSMDFTTVLSEKKKKLFVVNDYKFGFQRTLSGCVERYTCVKRGWLGSTGSMVYQVAVFGWVLALSEQRQNGPPVNIRFINSIQATFRMEQSPNQYYSTESLPLLDKHRSKLTAVEMKYLRRTVGKTRRDRIRNDRIRAEVKLRKALTEVINERQLKWFGHVYRMGEERKVKQVMEMRVEGRKRRGRPRIKWEDTIERIGQQEGKNNGRDEENV
ncbi:hypothetical protein ANN_11208 [Periplaneta americana]|uniref:Uncharacterized protein n=1 Tax=Periplaneta americana TaxID=6978 RepID=A0ABQ8T539_PERAM|nr:hypothetical protein ANN_11208 [Periplaneta americana]